MSEALVEAVRPDGLEMAMVHRVFPRTLAEAPVVVRAVAAWQDGGRAAFGAYIAAIRDTSSTTHEAVHSSR